MKDDDDNNKWFQMSLQLLRYPNASLVDIALMTTTSNNMDASDESFQDLTLWLEDRIIREWSIDQRKPLREKDLFWKQMILYLNDLECPQSYYNNDDEKTATTTTTTTPWYRDISKRKRALYWMISCAIWEARGDAMKKQQEQTNNNNNKSRGSSTSSVVDTKTTTTTALSSHEIQQQQQLLNDTTSFPLGFTTGDAKVDTILKRKRMIHLLQLRKEQDHINAQIATMQQTTVQKSKPMKKPSGGRQRQHGRRR